MSILSGSMQAVMGSDATTEAAQTQAAAADRAAAVQQQMYDETVARMSPYYQQGLAYQTELAGRMPSLTRPYSLDAYRASPEYANQMLAMQQARDTLTAQGAASGMYGGGTWGAAMQQRANELAQQGYTQGLQDYWGQNMNIYGMYQPLVASGQNAAANLAAQGANVANQLSNIYQQGAAQQGAYQSLAGQQFGAGMGRVGAGAGELAKGAWNYFTQSAAPYAYQGTMVELAAPAYSGPTVTEVATTVA